MAQSWGCFRGRGKDRRTDREKCRIAFQIEDDILDITSTTEVLGKPVHSDEKNEKTTYVTLYGVEMSAKIVEEKSKEAITLLRKLPGKNTYLEELLLALIHRDK